MKYPVEIWAVLRPERMLEVFKHVTDFGVAIAWVEFRQWRGKELIDVGLIMPYCEEDRKWQYTHRTFNKMLFSISGYTEYDGIKVYDLPLSPYAPGMGEPIELKDCLFVPEGFSAITD